MNLSSKIESILFYKGESVSIKQLAGFLNESELLIEKELGVLKDGLCDRGIRVILNNGKAMLGTAPEMSKTIEFLRKEELSKDIGKAGLETLAVILYSNSGARKSEVDYIRGVNSASILRNLLVRGLVERKIDEKNQRSFLYFPTLDLLSFLGVSSISEMPEIEKIKEKFSYENQFE